MSQVDHINKDMIEFDLIDVDSLDLSDDQTWLYTTSDDSGQKVDIIDWNLSIDGVINEDEDYIAQEKQFHNLLDRILKNENPSMSYKHKIDSRTYVKRKNRQQRPCVQNIVDYISNPPSMSSQASLSTTPNKYLTYNKHSSQMGPKSALLRLKTFSVDTNTEDSNIKDDAMKRRSRVTDEYAEVKELDRILVAAGSCSTAENFPAMPINFDLSQVAHNVYNSFNKGAPNLINERGSLNMDQSGECLTQISPPSLVSSLVMENSGMFNLESMESRKSMPSYRDSGMPTSGRDSMDPMLTSMTLSILDEKDMSTSFLSQTTYPDNDSIMDSLPPSLVSSVKSSYIISNSSKPEAETTDTNIFSSATFTHLDQSGKLLSARPRCQLYNSFKRESGIRNSESYTKAREEGCQMDLTKILNENSDKKDFSKNISKPIEIEETITLHYTNNKFKRNNDAEKENIETDDAFYKEMGVQKPEDVEINAYNRTLGKEELNTIIQARQKLSLARKTLPAETETTLPIQIDTSIKTTPIPNLTTKFPKQRMENASEWLSRRKAMNAERNGLDRQEEKESVRETPKRNATFKKTSRSPAMDATIVIMKPEENQMIDINSATLNLIDGTERTNLQEERGLQERAMVGSSDSTDTGTFSSSSPPDSVPDNVPVHDPRQRKVSMPLMSLRMKAKNDMLDPYSSVSPTYDVPVDKAHALAKSPSGNSNPMETKKDILANASSEKKSIPTPTKSIPSRLSPTNTASHGSLTPPFIPRKTGLPTSKLRQYSSHRELNKVPTASTSSGLPRGATRLMIRRGVYASNPALSRTSTPDPPTVVTNPEEEKPSRPSLINPPPPAARPMYRRDMYASNPALSPTSTPDLLNVLTKPEEEKPSQPTLINPPVLERQGTETLRRGRPHSQLIAPRDPTPTRAYLTADAPAQPHRVAKPASSGTLYKQTSSTAPITDQPRPLTGESRMSALPRPSRLPAPRRGLRPPSVYKTSPATDEEHN